jgi:non-heme chloroperoxidase
MAYLEREAGKHIYFENYPAPGTPLMLVHGWGMSCRTWDTTVTALCAAGHHVAALDLRGCGKSDKDFSDTSIGAGASDVEALVTHLSLASPVLVGWSLGGAVCVEAAHRLDGRCRALVLMCAATPCFVRTEDFPYGSAREDFLGTVKALGADRANFLYELSRGLCTKPVSEQEIAWLWSIFMETSTSADITMAELGSLDQREILAALQMPVLSIYGEKDGIVPPEIGRFAAELAPNGRAVEFKGCGHVPQIEDGEKFRAVLLSFIEECSR